LVADDFGFGGMFTQSGDKECVPTHLEVIDNYQPEPGVTLLL
jgi:hypothetical protein